MASRRYKLASRCARDDLVKLAAALVTSLSLSLSNGSKAPAGILSLSGVGAATKTLQSGKLLLLTEARCYVGPGAPTDLYSWFSSCFQAPCSFWEP